MVCNVSMGVLLKGYIYYVLIILHVIVLLVKFVTYINQQEEPTLVSSLIPYLVLSCAFATSVLFGPNFLYHLN